MADIYEVNKYGPQEGLGWGPGGAVDDTPETRYERWKRTSPVAKTLKFGLPLLLIALAFSVTFLQWPF